MSRIITWNNALYIAAIEAYENEVVETEMERLIIGEYLEFESREAWISNQVVQWLQAARDGDYEEELASLELPEK